MRTQRVSPRGHGAGSTLGPPGVALVLTLLLVGLLLVMAMTLLSLSASDSQVATNESRSIQALFSADAGTEEAKMRLSPTAPTAARIPVGTTSAWRAYVLSGQTQAAIPTLDPTFGLTRGSPATAEATTGYLYYNTVQTSNAIQWGWARIQLAVNSASATNPLACAGAYTTANPGTLPVYWDPANNCETTVVSASSQPILIATSEGIQQSVRRMISVEFLPNIGSVTNDPFADAAHGVSGVTLVGLSETDSYDSRNGAYCAACPVSAGVGNNRHAKGDVSTDSTAAGAISTTANTVVNGQAIVGPGGDPSTGIAANGTITGATSAAAQPWNLPAVTIPAGLTSLGALSLSGNPHGACSQTVTEGKYLYSSIAITGQAKLCITGKVEIYVTGDINIGGNGIANLSGLPTNMMIYALPTCATVSIHGNGDFYGAVYAPSAAIQVSGNGSVYGALTGNTVQINGSNGARLHYDEALGDLAASTTYATTGFSRYSWREIPF